MYDQDSKGSGSSGVSDEDIGIRALKVNRSKAVERVIRRVRQNLGDSWQELTASEIEELEWIIGQLWSHVSRTEWENLAFGHMGLGDVIRMLVLGDQLRRRAQPSIEILGEAKEIVRRKPRVVE